MNMQTLENEQPRIKRHPRILLRAAGAALAMTAYLALEWISFIHEYKGLPVTPWNPGLGVLFAGLVFAGPAAGLLLFAGVVTAETVVLRTDLDWGVVVALAALTSSSYTAIVDFARRKLALDTSLSHVRDVLVLLGAGLCGAIASGILMTGFLIAVGTLEWRDLWKASLPLMIGDVIGIAVVTPLLLRFVVHRQHIMATVTAAITAEALVLTGAIMAALFLVVAENGSGGHRLFYILFLPAVAAALRHGLDGACVALAATQLGLVGLLHLHGYDAQVFTDFQTQMLVLTATGLIVGVAVTETRQAERRAREAQLQLRQKEIEAAQAARLNLVSGMATALAHEITQPMTAARALARSVQHILRTPGGNIERADTNVTTLITQIDHAGAVLHRVRDFLRRGTPHLSTLDVRALITDALALADADAAVRRIAIELSVSDGLPPLHGDHVQLQQVLINLVRNAIESLASTGRAGRIVISARRIENPPGVEIGVGDDGPGIPPHMSESIFQPLATSKHEGLGLGLPICASIVAAHGGRIWLHSAKPGETEFRLFLPSSPPTAR
jgi:signal transduction histidine kinase